MSDYLKPYINITAIDISFNILFKAYLIVFQANKFFYFINTEMTCKKIIVIVADKFYLNDFGYK